ncbi:MAG: EAL domain-containing protein [Acholeplasmataceae bacterium]
MAVITGYQGGLLAGLISGILLGPFMPIDVATGEEQDAINWLYRMFILLSSGGLAGISFDILRKSRQAAYIALSHHHYTMITLYNSLSLSYRKEIRNQQVIAIRVVNFQSIVDYIGVLNYFEIWKMINEEISNCCDFQGKLYHIEDQNFIYVCTQENKEMPLDELYEMFAKSRMINDVPIYFDIAIGFAKRIDSLDHLVEDALITSRHAELNSEHLLTFKPEFRKSLKAFELVSELKEAMKNKDLYLVYQPVVKSNSHEIKAVEALVRWRHKTQGLIMPGAFIELVEQTLLINDLSYYIAKEVKEEILPDLMKNDIQVSINISGKNFKNKNFMQQLLSEEIFTDQEKKYVILEITETVFMGHVNQVLELLLKLKSKGYMLALDDFGVGFTSLSYLGKYPLDYLKIDRSFMMQYHELAIQSIVKSVIHLTKELEYQVVAEGIETKEMVEQLEEIKCDFFQGYYFSKPIEKLEILKLIHKK